MNYVRVTSTMLGMKGHSTSPKQSITNITTGYIWTPSSRSCTWKSTINKKTTTNHKIHNKNNYKIHNKNNYKIHNKNNYKNN